MKQKEYYFEEAKPLIHFFEKYRKKIIGHILENYYSWQYMFVEAMVDEISFIVLDDIVLGFEYYTPSSVYITLASKEDFVPNGKKDELGTEFVDFQSKLKDRESMKDLWNYSYIPSLGQKIIDIKIDTFSDAIYSCYDEEKMLRPYGGDYFDTIRLILEDGTNFCISADCYDYMSIRLEKLPVLKTFRKELSVIPNIIYFFDHITKIIKATNPKPDELSLIAMEYMDKCLNEKEEYLKKLNDRFSKSYLYSDSLWELFKIFVEAGMNKEYIDKNGISIKEKALSLGEVSKSIIKYFS